jgi:nucleotide-binding universal stress UspA family protein
MTISRILVPLDGSRLAEQGLRCAAMMARGTGAEILLFQAVAIPADVHERLAVAGEDPETLLAQLASEAGGYLRELAEQLRESGLSAAYAVERGRPADAILHQAGRPDVDQIVMATHGYSGLRRWTHGSVAERVLQSAEVPVLMVRAREEDLEVDWREPMACGRILVPLDGSSLAEQILPVATKLARAVGAQLVLFQVPIVHVTGWMTGEWFLPVQGVLGTAEADAERYLKGVAGRLEGQVEVATATSVGSVAECIIDYAAAGDIDLVAMCTHGRTGLARWALGSVADRVLRAGTTPILLMRAQRAAAAGRRDEVPEEAPEDSRREAA